MFRKRPLSNSGASGSNNDSNGSKNQRVVDNTKMMLDIAKESADWFPPLKAALGGVTALIKHYEQFQNVKEKIQELLPQLDRFKKHIRTTKVDGDPEETNRREDLAGAFKQIEEEAHKLSEKKPLARLADKAQDSGVVARLFEQLREAIVSYQLSQQQAIYNQITHLTSSFNTLLKLQEVTHQSTLAMALIHNKKTETPRSKGQAGIRCGAAE
ncbi:hypothetical protein BJ322DRAFT_850660 [Thelephora terrestris]|uniref:Uncharacterized protein n=1 Tax=Thelephora terrestris TaxID=56493 RepID=A0A9P6HCU5_9AGAM|nr:hypothetical protein BJ322DRAFT_850660 [Thelephora terrestris]